MGRRIDLRLCVITDLEMSGSRRLEQVVLDAIEGGATMVQYRDKAASMRERYERASPLCSIVKGKGVPLIVNDHADLALALNADGIHLGQDDLPAAVARRILGERSIIGVSVGSVAETHQAERDGADYVSIGPLYATQTKPDAGPVVSRETVTEVAHTARIPVVAIGGINASNVAQVMALGVSGVAVISAIMASENPMLAAREIADTMNVLRSDSSGN